MEKTLEVVKAGKLHGHLLAVGDRLEVGKDITPQDADWLEGLDILAPPSTAVKKPSRKATRSEE